MVYEIRFYCNFKFSSFSVPKSVSMSWMTALRSSANWPVTRTGNVSRELVTDRERQECHTIGVE